MSSGLHVVRKARTGKPVRWYIYAWRGGPCIFKKEGGPRPVITGTIIDAAAAVRHQLHATPKDTLASLIEGFRASADFNKLAKSTKQNWETWLPRIGKKFGTAPLAAFNDRRMRGKVLEWRDQWVDKPRGADMAMQVFSRLLSFGFDRGTLSSNILFGVAKLYNADRSDIIWEKSHFDTFYPNASVEVEEAVELDASTGLRRGDLLKLPWTAIGDHAIIWKTGKSRGKAQIVIPLLPEAKAVLARIKARYEGRELPKTVLVNSRGKTWTPNGFSSSFDDAREKAGLDVHFHDLRGTFATRCMIAGLTDQEIADILGWTTKEVAKIRSKYVDQARVVIALAERISKAAV